MTSGHKEKLPCFQPHLECPSQPANYAGRLRKETVECFRVVGGQILSFSKEGNLQPEGNVLLALGQLILPSLELICLLSHGAGISLCLDS